MRIQTNYPACELISYQKKKKKKKKTAVVRKVKVQDLVQWAKCNKMCLIKHTELKITVRRDFSISSTSISFLNGGGSRSDDFAHVR